MWNRGILSKYPEEKALFKAIGGIFTGYMRFLKKKHPGNKCKRKELMHETYWKGIPISDMMTQWEWDDFVKTYIPQCYQTCIPKTKRNFFSQDKSILMPILKKAYFQILENEKVIICPSCNINYLFYGSSDLGNSKWGEKDHFYPRNSHPDKSFLPSNITPICRDCNNDKSDNEPPIAIVRKYPYDFHFNVNFSFFTNWIDCELTDNCAGQFLDIFLLKERYEFVTKIGRIQSEYNEWLNKKLILENVHGSRKFQEEALFQAEFYKKHKNDEPFSKFKHDLYIYFFNLEKTNTP